MTVGASVGDIMAPMDLPDHLAHAITNRGLKLILNSTEQCNLRCTYCYESFSQGHMSKGVIEGILRLVEKRAAAGLDWLEIEFFGGEPLAAWSVVETLSSQIHAICRHYRVKLLGSITTNATLLRRPRLDTLVKNEFKAFQITVDGPQQLHDKRRITRAGGGTYHITWQRLTMLKQSPYDIDILIRVHFDSATKSAIIDMKDFLEALADQFFIEDKRFRLHFHPIEPWGRAAAATVAFFSDYSTRAATQETLLKCARDAGISCGQLPQRLPGLPTGESGHVVCYAARANAFVVRSDGRLSKCTVAFEDDRNVVGHILPNGELRIDHDRHLPWLRGLISGDGDSLRCPAAGIIWASS